MLHLLYICIISLIEIVLFASIREMAQICDKNSFFVFFVSGMKISQHVFSGLTLY